MPKPASSPARQAGLVIGFTLGGLVGLVVGLFIVFALKLDPTWRLLGMVIAFFLGAGLAGLFGSIWGRIMDIDTADPPNP